MKNTFGNNIAVTIFGESHGEMLGAVLDGLPAGLPIDMEYIREKMRLRNPEHPFSTARREPDEIRMVSGVWKGRTTGTSLAILIENQDMRSGDYEAFKNCPRPGHSDYSASVKYHGYHDYRGGGHSSGRITAALVAAGAVLQSILEKKGILIGTHVISSGEMEDQHFSQEESVLREEIIRVNGMEIPVLREDAKEALLKSIGKAKEEKNSVGGILETTVLGLEAGIGEPWFDSLEGMLAHGIFSIPGVKGISFGEGFDFAKLNGSTANDVFLLKDGMIRTKTNHNGGINGGISNGMPLVLQTVLKPTPTIGLAQNTLNMATGEIVALEGKGRHDPGIFIRARVVVDSMVALVLADFLCARYGSEYLRLE